MKQVSKPAKHISENGSSVRITTATDYSVDFEITTAANYLLRWYMPKASAGMNEGLVGNIRLVLHSEDTSVDSPEDQLTDKSIIKIFNPQGQQIPQLQRGVNIVVHADGTTSKVYQ